MSKELEALLKDFETIAGYNPYRCDDNEQLWNLRVIECLPEVNWEALKQALTPPTADEVCKYYEEVYRTPLIYNRCMKQFEEIKGGRAQGKIIATLNGYTVKFLHPLILSLVALIVRFYESEATK